MSPADHASLSAPALERQDIDTSEPTFRGNKATGSSENGRPWRRKIGRVPLSTVPESDQNQLLRRLRESDEWIDLADAGLLPANPQSVSDLAYKSFEGKRVVGEAQHFACPFFKRDPTRYGGTQSCGQRNWKTIQHLRQHIYRHHKTENRCSRCWQEVPASAYATPSPPNSCPNGQVHLISGISDRQEFDLRSQKKRKSSMTSDKDIWTRMYKILFPDDVEMWIPSPYWYSADKAGFLRHEIHHRLSSLYTPDSPRMDTESADNMVEWLKDMKQRLLEPVDFPLPFRLKSFKALRDSSEPGYQSDTESEASSQSSTLSSIVHQEWIVVEPLMTLTAQWLHSWLDKLQPRKCPRNSQTEPGSAARTSVVGIDGKSSAKIGASGKRKRASHNGKGNDDEEQDKRRKKHQDWLPSSAQDRRPKFACPFFKRRPRSCENNACRHGFKEVAKVRDHIYEVHKLLPRCPRCGDTFQSDGLKDAHLLMDPVCEKKLYMPLQGIDQDQKKQLGSRAREVANMTEVERWRRMWKICFPYDDPSSIPSPFDEVLDFCESQRTGGDDISSLWLEVLKFDLLPLLRETLVRNANSGAHPPLEALTPRDLPSLVRGAYAQLRQRFSGKSGPGTNMRPFDNLQLEQDNSHLDTLGLVDEHSDSLHHILGPVDVSFDHHASLLNETAFGDPNLTLPRFSGPANTGPGSEGGNDSIDSSLPSSVRPDTPDDSVQFEFFDVDLLPDQIVQSGSDAIPDEGGSSATGGFGNESVLGAGVKATQDYSTWFRCCACSSTDQPGGWGSFYCWHCGHSCIDSCYSSTVS